MNLEQWLTQRQGRDYLSPDEWRAARLAMQDQVEALDADAPACLHWQRDLFSSPDPACPWFVVGESELLNRESFAVWYFRKGPNGEPRDHLYHAFVVWRNGELELASAHQGRKFGPGWRASVMAAHLVDPADLRNEVVQ